MRWRFFIIAIAYIVSACGQETIPPRNAYTIARPVLEPRSLGRTLSLSQLVTGEYGGHTYQMRYEIDILPERLAIVGLSPLGITLFTIVQEHGRIVSEVFVREGPPIDPEYLILDLHLIYWPSKPLREALENAGMRLEETGKGSMRRLLDMNGTVLAEVRYKIAPRPFDEIDVVHFDYGYSLNIRNIGLPRTE